MINNLERGCDGEVSLDVEGPGLSGEGLGGPTVLHLGPVHAPQGVIEADRRHPRRTA